MRSGKKSVDEALDAAARAIEGARYLSAFTGAGVSVESGVPAFRGKEGLWSRYDPKVLEIGYFTEHPDACWPVIREIFYDHFGRAAPNSAHLVLARLEHAGRLQALITQNIDDLHYKAGSRRVVEFHGSSRMLLCARCGQRFAATEVDLRLLPPRCRCGAILKPDFVFFGEGIPQRALEESEEVAARTDVMLVIGTTGEVYPAAAVPRAASQNGALIVEINPERSLYTDEIADVVVHLPAARAMTAIEERLSKG